MPLLARIGCGLMTCQEHLASSLHGCLLVCLEGLPRKGYGRHSVLELLQPPGLRGLPGPDPTRQTEDGCCDSRASFLSADGGTSHPG